MSFSLGSSQKLFCGILAIMFASLALLFGLVGMFSCRTVVFNQDEGGGELKVGLFGYTTKSFYYVQDDNTLYATDVCVSYDWLNDNSFDYTTDKKTDALQGLAISIAVIGGFFTIFSCVVPCCPNLPQIAWKGVGLIFIICCILQGCTLMILDSSICTDNPVIQFVADTMPATFATVDDPYKCQPSVGYNLIIAATVFWFLAGVIPVCAPAPSWDGAVDDLSPPAAEKPDVESTNNAEPTSEEKP